METKTCSKCGETKTLDGFYKHSGCKYGVHPSCKACRSAYHAKNAETENARSRAYKAANREAISTYNKAYQAKNAEAITARHKVYRAENSEAISAQMKTWRAENSDHLSAYSRRYKEMYYTQLVTERPFHKMWFTATKHKLDRGREDLITPEQIEELYLDQGGLCAYSGVPIPLEYLADKWHPLAPSLERLDCKEAHTFSNCVLVRRMLNIVRMNRCLKTFLGYMETEIAPGYTQYTKVADYLDALG